MNLLDRLQAIESRRQTWEVTVPHTKHATVETPETIHRILALRSLEMVVADWTALTIMNHTFSDEGSATPSVADILLGHQQDEDKHDQQLTILAGYWKAEPRPEADSLISRWEKDPSEPLCKKLVLEAMVFFQILAVLPDLVPGDAFTQAVRQWILFDESAHVASARVLVKEAGMRIHPDLVNLAMDTIDWMLGDLPPEQVARYKMIARQVIKTGKSDLVNDMSVVSHQDFFTQRDNRSIVYAS